MVVVFWYFCILFHLYFVAFVFWQFVFGSIVFCGVCILAFYICILFHLHFVAFVFCYICILAICILSFCIMLSLNFEFLHLVLFVFCCIYIPKKNYYLTESLQVSHLVDRQVIMLMLPNGPNQAESEMGWSVKARCGNSWQCWT